MANRLAEETSPYLRQHADNPVDWYPWCEAAFAAAAERGVPVLLSIGYSACHWCHVMAHESFEDERTAELMNRLYVNIKVDREERPDVDKIYQVAHQLITQRGGGWPLTMFLNPEDQRPFFGGTYFPKESRYGMPAFGELLRHVSSYYAEHREELRQQGEQLVGVLGQLNPPPAGAAQVLDGAPLAAARERFAQSFDREYGGFGGAPKFPQPTTIDRLLRTWRDSAASDEPDLDALYMATLTLKRMAEGGLFDHLGGGFCRYSVDRYWQIPHFEKMLYDNGLLLALYAQAYLATGEREFADVASRTADWMLTDMRADNGGFYSSRDADSEGVEGKYYVWTRDEVEALLDDEVAAVVSRRFGLDETANFEGRYHLTVKKSIQDIAGALGLSADEVEQRLERGSRRLLAARERRVAPARDDKQLTSWNALAIRGLAIAGRALGRSDFVAASANAVDFLHERLYEDGRLRAVYKDGESKFAAYLDDHAFLLDAILELLQARWCNRHLAFATGLADTLLGHFADREAGGFWFTADDHEPLIVRPKPFADEAVPSGNGIAAFALQRLGCLLGDTRYLDAAEGTLRAAWQAISEYPHGHAALLAALEEAVDETEIIVIRGDAGEIGRWSASAARLYAPRRLVFAIPAGVGDLPGALAERKPQGETAVAYRCLGQHCELPVTSWEALAARIGGA